MGLPIYTDGLRAGRPDDYRKYTIAVTLAGCLVPLYNAATKREAAKAKRKIVGSGYASKDVGIFNTYGSEL